MAIFRRSDTNADAVSQFTPESFLGRIPFSAARVRARRPKLRGLGQEFFTVESGDPYPVTAPASNGFDWGGLLGTAKEILTTVTQAELQKDLYQMNVQRAQQGLPPISPSAVAPQVNVGVAPDVQRNLMMLGIGAAAIVGGAMLLGGRRGSRRRR